MLSSLSRYHDILKFAFSLGIANQEKRSLAQRCELWKNKFKKSSQEKDLVCEVAEKDKAVLSNKIKALKTKCVIRKKIIQVKNENLKSLFN